MIRYKLILSLVMLFVKFPKGGYVEQATECSYVAVKQASVYNTQNNELRKIIKELKFLDTVEIIDHSDGMIKVKKDEICGWVNKESLLIINDSFNEVQIDANITICLPKYLNFTTKISNEGDSNSRKLFERHDSSDKYFVIIQKFNINIDDFIYKWIKNTSKYNYRKIDKMDVYSYSGVGGPNHQRYTETIFNRDNFTYNICVFIQNEGMNTECEYTARNITLSFLYK